MERRILYLTAQVETLYPDGLGRWQRPICGGGSGAGLQGGEFIERLYHPLTPGMDVRRLSSLRDFWKMGGGLRT